VGGLLAAILVLVTFALTLHACRLSLRRLAPSFEAKSKAPTVRPSARVALRPDEIDFENEEELAEAEADADETEGEADGPSRWSLAFGVVAHWTLSGAARMRRFIARHTGGRPGSTRRLYDHAYAPEPGLARVGGRIEPQFADDE